MQPSKEVGDVDENKDVYISGYNFHFHRKVSFKDRCGTVGGPNMNQKCKFPFLYKISENETIEKNVCSLSMPPSHAECDMLARSKNWTERVPKDMNKIIIRKDISKLKDRAKLYPGVKSKYVMLDCYAEYFQSGWCGTCLKSARPGQPGYCGEGAAESEEDRVVASNSSSIPGCSGRL